MKKYLKILLLAVAILVFGFIALQNRSISTRIGIRNATQNNFANLRISNGSAQESYDISDFIGKTALEATQAKLSVVTNGTGINAFVTSIDGRRADTNKHEFWEFDVNRSEAQVGAGSYVIQNHDEIEWKINNY